MKIKVKKLHEEAIVPRYAKDGDSGMDLFTYQDVTIPAGERKMIGTGIAIEYPEGYCSLIWDKSGLAAKHGLKVLGGVFEHTYRGEYVVILLNTSDKEYIFNKGEKIAQLLFQPIVTAEVEVAEELSESIRGEGGFGSTGK